MSYMPAGYEDEYDSSDSDDFYVGGPFSKGDGSQNNSMTNGSSGGFRMATPSKVQTDQQGSPLALDDFKMAASRGNLEEVKEFLQKEIAVDCMLKAGWTALMYASSCGQAAMVKFLLEKGADPNFNRASFMYSPLMAVCSSNLPEDSILECLTILTDHGANVNTHEKSHMTPLMFASLHGHARAVEKLLACGAEVDYSDNRRWTALFYAAEGGHTRVVELLLASRADATRCCSDGTAADIAYNKNHVKLAELLEAAGNPAKSHTANGTANGTSNGTASPAPASPVRIVNDTQQEPEIATTTTATPATPTTTTSINNHEPPPQPPPPTITTTTTTPSQPPQQESYHVLNDLELFLYGVNLGSLIPSFKEHSITFDQLLQMTESDLEKVGVSQVGHRKKILDSIHAIHKKKWEPGSIRNPSNNITLEETHAILDNVSRHLMYITSSIQYFENHLTSRGTLTDPQQTPGSLDQVSKVSGELLSNTAKLHQKLSEFKRTVSEAAGSTDIIPADLIEDPDKAGMSTLKKTIMALTAVGVVVSIVWFKKPVWKGFIKTS